MALTKRKKQVVAGAAIPLLALGLGLAGARSSRAQEKPPEKPADDKKPVEKPEEKKPPEEKPAGEAAAAESAKMVALSRFLEAWKVNDYAQAEKYWDDLTKEYNEFRGKPDLLYKLAWCQFNQPTRKDQCAATLASLIEKEPSHIQGLFLLSRLKVTSPKTQDQEQAKELLLTAARHGLYVLREIQANAKEFGGLLTQPQFVLRAMRATQEFQVGPWLPKARNPMQTPWRLYEKAGDPTRPAVDPKRVQELESKIGAIFEDIERFAKQQQIDELSKKFAELDALMREYGKMGLDEATKKIQQWDKRLEEFKEIRLAIKLQIAISGGNQFLANMAKAIDAEKFEVAFENFANLKTHVEQMKHEDREEFHRNADALFTQGRLLDLEAKKKKKIKEFNLVVTGIVVDPRPDSKDRAIINNKIYEPGDPVVDANENEIAGLRVVKIQPESVRFKYEDTEFFRPLKGR